VSIEDRFQIQNVRTLSDDWFTLKMTTFAWRRLDGAWQTMNCEIYDRGDAAALQSRGKHSAPCPAVPLPAYVNGYDDLLIEAPAELLDEPKGGMPHPDIPLFTPPLSG
jgi:hypothetical protein